MRFAVIACSACRQPWAVEQRHDRVTCPHCRSESALKERALLWEGQDARSAAEAAGRLRAELAGMPQIPPPTALVRHDSPEDAAAAKAQGIINRSRRAEEVATWLTRLVGQPSHDQMVESLRNAGLDRDRAEREVVRMLAMDFLTEPRAGSYRALAI